GLEKKPAAPAVAEPTATTKVPVAAAPAHKTETAQQPAPAAAPASLIDPPAATEAVEVEEDVTDGAENSTQAAPQAAAPLAAAPATTPSTSRPTAVDQPIKRIRSGNAGTPNTAAAKSSAMMWEAAKGADLKDTLTEWSKNSTMKLVWNAKANYAIGTTIMVYGSFNDAMKALFAEGSKSGSFPVMRFTDDGAGRSTLVVDDKSS
ncbi:MAG TPA: TcpQ domain-containing protein, partial [Alphaproteobacteria bacterium]|nr:TcpQ domain-containing protein [Alphaproteobacteria bacterium]